MGEYDAACHLVVPKVEAAARALLLQLNEPLYRTQVGDNVGQFPGLGSLLPALLDNGFDPDWERFLRTLLLGEGDNLRNLVAHGFADNVGAEQAALALRAASVMGLLASGADSQHDKASVREALAHPVGVRSAQRPLRQRILAAMQAARREWRS